MYQYKGSTEEKDLSKYDKIESNLSLNQTEALLTVSDLPEGYYYFKETATKDDLFLDETPSKVIYIGPAQQGSTVDVSVENERFATNVTLTKTDAGDSKSYIGNTGDPISGTQFTLYKINGENQEKIETTTTQDDGTLKFVIGQKGTYQIVETKAAKGYLIGDNPYMAQFTVNNGKDFQNATLDLSKKVSDAIREKYQLEIGNDTYTQAGISNERELGRVTLTKVSTTNEKLSDVTFQLFCEGAEKGEYQLVQEASTGSDGSLTIGNLPWGNYYMIETKQENGYVLDSSRHNFTIDANHATEIELLADLGTITNAHTNISVKKTTSTGKMLSGAVLKLTGKFADGSTELEWKTTKSPKELTGKLIVGNKYTLTEVKAPKGYVASEESISVMLTSKGELKKIKKDYVTSKGNVISFINLTVEEDEELNGGETSSHSGSSSSSSSTEKSGKGSNGAKTGDQTPIEAMAMMLIAAAGAIFLLRRKK